MTAMTKGWHTYGVVLTALLAVALLAGTATPSAASREGRRNTGLAIAGVALLYALSQSGSNDHHYRNRSHYRQPDSYRHSYGRSSYDRHGYRHDGYRQPRHTSYRSSSHRRYQPSYRTYHRSHGSGGGYRGYYQPGYGW